MAEDPESWRHAQFRQQIRTKIEETIRQYGQSAPKSVNELENHVYSKAKTREEYLNMTARLMHYIKENSQKKQGAGGIVGVPNNAIGAGGGGGVFQQTIISQNMANQSADPISSLQNLTSSQASGDMHGNVMITNQGINETSIAPSSVGQVTMVSGNVAQMQINQGGQQILQRLPQNRMVVNQMMMANSMQPQTQNAHMLRPMMQAGNVQMMQRMTHPPGVQLQQTADSGFYSNQQLQPGQQHSQSTALPPPPSQQQQQQQSQQQQQQQLPMQNFQQNMNAQFQPNQNIVLNTQMQQNLNLPHVAMNQQHQPPPPPAANMAPSPNFMQSPQGVMSSPMSVGGISQRAQLSVSSAPSPGPLNTPVMANTQSPAARVVNDDQAYLDKLKQLSKYIEPLRKMITKLDRDESLTNERKNHLSKINNLLEIISDSNRRCSMEILLKCEQVLDKMEFKFRPEPSSIINNSGGNSGSGLSNMPMQQKMQDHYIGQALLDAVQANIKKPFFNHTLHRTFAPAVAALISSGYSTVNIPATKRKAEKLSDVPEILQGEIARLDQRFKVQMDPLQHSGSKAIYLICRLDDKDLPCVPPISLSVPEAYPSKPPLCQASEEDEYSASPFLCRVQRTFSDALAKLGSNYSVTTILNRWEMCVRQACN